MVKKLAEQGLAEHTPYKGVTLTTEGKRVALEVVRRHRLLELYLAEHLDVPWDRVHTEADRLEHVLSEELEARIAAKLGHPTHDPHGDPIPTVELTLAEDVTTSLATLDPGARGRLVRVSDTNPEMLRYLTGQRVAVGDTLEVVDRQPFDGAPSPSASATSFRCSAARSQEPSASSSIDPDHPRVSQPIPQHLTSRLAAVLLAAATLGASACGAGDGDGVRITMDNLRFTPREATVRAGQRIEWRNDEKVPHNVAATSGADFRSMTLGDDGTFAFTARRPGTIQYVCTLHPGMTGSLRITGD